jgi:hypothetical protein
VVISDLQTSHPLFALFQTPGQGDFRPARYYRTRALREPSGTTLARFEDGAPALVESAVGEGRVMLWASTLDRSWNDLALRPVFLPFVHRMLAHLARYSPPSAWTTVGRPVALRTELEARRSTVDSRALDSMRVFEPSGQPAEQDETDDPVFSPRQPGFYEVRYRRGDRDEVVTLAVNPDPTEADLTPMDATEAVTAAAGVDPSAPPPDPDETSTPEARERQQGVWQYLLLAVLLALVAETMVAARSRV